MKTRNLLPISAILIALPAFAISEVTWKQHTIEAADPVNHLAGADGIRVGDANGDGLPDLVTGWEEGQRIRIYLNPGPENVRDPWEKITVGKVKSAEDAVFADLDGDGRLDVVSATEGKSRTMYVHWAPDKGDYNNEEEWKTEAFPTAKGNNWWMFTEPCDVDNDGDIDFIAGSKNTGAGITLFLNPGGKGARTLKDWTVKKVSDAGWIMTIRVVEQDGKRILVFTDRKGDRSGIYFAPILSEAPWIGEPVRIGAAGEEVMFLDLAHLDDDKKLDVAVAIRPRTIRFYYQPENPFQKWKDSAELDLLPETFGQAKAVRVGLLDDDNIPDFAITCEHANGEKVGALWSNMFSEYTAVSNSTGIKYDRIELTDLDADGDLDLITCEERAGLGVIWFENPLK